MNYVILDLEWNSSYSDVLKRYVNEIIEFGAVKVNEDFDVVDKFSMLVHPQISKKLSSHVVSKTHISNKEVFGSHNSFLYAFQKFGQFCKDSILLTWGTLDVLTLVDNYEYYTGKIKLPFLEKYCNLQEYCEKALGVYNPGRQVGLLDCANKIGIYVEESGLHRAYADASLSFRCMKHLYNEADFNKLVRVADDGFYRKLIFRNKKITDINHPLINKAELAFCCDKCGGKVEQYTPFKMKNKSFIADYFCPQCCNDFKGRISLKLQYDKVLVSKQILPDLIEKKNTEGKYK